MFSSMFVFALRFNSTPPSIVDTIHRICRLVHPHNSQYHAIKMCLKYITISMLNIFFFFGTWNERRIFCWCENQIDVGWKQLEMV